MAAAVVGTGRWTTLDRRRPQAQKPFSLGAAMRAAKSGDLAVVSVVENGPCGRAGVCKGDVVLAVDGERVLSLDQIASCLEIHGARAAITMTLRAAATGAETEITLNRSAIKSSLDVAEALRQTAAVPPAPAPYQPNSKPLSESPRRARGAPTEDRIQTQTLSGKERPSASSTALQAGKNATTRTALQDMSNNLSLYAQQPEDMKNSWIVEFAPGSAQKSAHAKPKCPGKKSSPAKSPFANRVRFGKGDTQHIFSNSSPTHSSTDTALTVASPSSPPPDHDAAFGGGHAHLRGGGWDLAHVQVCVQGRNPIFALSPPFSKTHKLTSILQRIASHSLSLTYMHTKALPNISPGSMSLQSLSLSPSVVGRSGVGGESFSYEIQQMHSLLFKSKYIQKCFNMKYIYLKHTREI